MQPPYRRPFDEDDDPVDEPLSPLDLRGGYRSRLDADDSPRRTRDDRPDADRPSLLARTSGAALDKRPSAQNKDKKDKGGGLKMPFRRSGDDPKSSPPQKSPFGVRGDDPRDDSGGRRLPFGGRGKDDKKPGDKKSGGGLGLPIGKSDKSGKQPGKKDSGGGKFSLPLGRGKDDKKQDRPARPALGGSPPPRSSGGKPDPKDEKKGGLATRGSRGWRSAERGPRRAILLFIVLAPSQWQAELSAT